MVTYLVKQPVYGLDGETWDEVLASFDNQEDAYEYVDEHGTYQAFVELDDDN